MGFKEAIVDDSMFGECLCTTPKGHENCCL